MNHNMLIRLDLCRSECFLTSCFGSFLLNIWFSCAEINRRSLKKGNIIICKYFESSFSYSNFINPQHMHIVQRKSKYIDKCSPANWNYFINVAYRLQMPRKVTKYMNATEEFNCKACSKTSQLDKKANKPRWLLPWIAETQIQQSQSKTDQAATTWRKCQQV